MATHLVVLVLKRFATLHHNRSTVLSELHSSFHLPCSHSATPPDQATKPVSACRHQHEAPEAHVEEYVHQVIAMCTSALLEIKNEVKELTALLNHDLHRPCLGGLMERVEKLESDRTLDSIQLVMLRRKSMLEGRDHSDEIHALEARTATLTRSIAQGMEEIQAEMVDLSG